MSTILVAHPSPDLYGSDLQLVETIHALVGAGHVVKVALPADGPLVPVLRQAGATVAIIPFTVLRKALLNPRGLVGLGAGAGPEALRLARIIRSSGARAVLTNTVTIPTWPLAARLAGVPAIAHAHEAEDSQPLIIRAGLYAPLLAARAVVANSGATRDVLLSAHPLLKKRTRVIHNGVPGPERPLPGPRDRAAGTPFRVALISRLSPRKGIDIALEAIGLLRAEGVDASLVVAGSVFPGYEWYEEQLRERISQPDLSGAVELLGYVNPTWPLLADADAVIVPSLGESFGNTAAEALHAGRPLVASRAQALREVVRDGETGLLVDPASPQALAAALAELERDPARARGLAAAGQADAAERFSVERYRSEIVDAVESLLQ
ncbi:glycosyltransferase family 4 protein [Actinomyces sp. zg296]|uniref:glycosyltransferase family 4 protein n=1 Tax=Actinomyces sp. zg296 TaxID=2609289 RepID=UPI0013579C59|nr:glycosyltransferase family 4 protein [Actinomyces sp. zg296]